VPARRHRQELGQPLHDPEDDALEPVHPCPFPWPPVLRVRDR
jgi:hypothetical protein